MTSNGKKKTAAVDDEVEEMLKAAEDEVFLKLSVDSHMSRVSPSYLHTDLDRRFQALKRPSSSSSSSKPNNKPTPNPKSAQPTTTTTEKDAIIVPSVQKEEDGDDLFARFAALKGSLPSSSSSVPPTRSDHGGVRINQPNDDGNGDEVEKIIQWAIDAARLDPSPPSDDEIDEDYDDDTDEEDNSDDDDGRVKTDKKSNRK